VREVELVYLDIMVFVDVVQVKHLEANDRRKSENDVKAAT